MPKIKVAASEFLASKRVVVTGVSGQPKDHGSNVVYRRLRELGYAVVAVNPNADEVDGDRCYHDLGSVPACAESAVGANMHGQPPSIIVMPRWRPYWAAASETRPAPGPWCIRMCSMLSSADARVVASAIAGLVAITTASTLPGSRDEREGRFDV